MSATSFDDDALTAAIDLVGRTGATGFEVGYVHDNVATEDAGWYAHAQYRGARVTHEACGPVEAAEGLARRLLNGGKCTHCGRTVTLSSVSAGKRCKWTRRGDRWARGCEGVR